MTMTLSKDRTSPLSIHLRIPQQIGGGSTSHWHIDFSGVTFDCPQQDGMWDIQLQGALRSGVAGELPPHGVEFIVNQFTCDGVLTDYRQLSQPVIFAVGDKASLLPVKKPAPPTKQRIRVCIDQHFKNEAILSNLIAHHGLSVNILAALLGSDSQHDGWFDLELRGTAEQVEAGLNYLRDLNLQLRLESSAPREW